MKRVYATHTRGPWRHRRLSSAGDGGGHRPVRAAGRRRSTGLPNVLILLDNTANWNTPFTNEIAALASTVNGLGFNTDGTAKFRLGLMLFTETGSGNSNVDGGYVRAAIRDLTSREQDQVRQPGQQPRRDWRTSRTAARPARPWPRPTSTSRVSRPTPATTRTRRTTRATSSAQRQSKAIYALPNNALPSKAGSPYTSPLVNGSCAGNYIIYISNGAVQDNNADNSTATTLAADPGDRGGPRHGRDDHDSDLAERLAVERRRRMGALHEEEPARRSRSTRSTSNKVTTGQGPGWTALLKSMASVTSGKYFDVSSGQRRRSRSRMRSAASSPRSRPSTACSHRSACRSASTPRART